ncbi:hypothetical protein [Desulfobacter postgatei]|uniref:hypothetical protein n=1 Tax=Desulfobacter postgatei TaxID=2293 RepID=UPI00259B4BB3|nr:hypothetical protein [uncultured Desulfobacter sp.]
MKRLLMIAYHFPPIQGSSGVHRTVQFARHLPKFGWEPIIVSVHPRAYPASANDWFGGLSKSVIIRRAFAVDSARHLAIKGRYLGITAVPDRWVSWWIGGTWECLRLIRKYKADALWSTFPIATAHLIALSVQSLTGLPWVADFRDPMIQKNQPESRMIRNSYKWIEKKSIQQSSAGIFVTQSSLNHYDLIYPDKDDNYWHLVENGYDEDLFPSGDDISSSIARKRRHRTIKMLHSGILYSKGRNPSPFLKALGSYLRKKDVAIEVTLRASGMEIDIEKWISSFNLNNVVKTKPSIPYADAIEEMIDSDVLILFQGAEYNKQIPAKVYEYIRAGRPILALVNAQGETADLLKKWDGIYSADINSPAEIENALGQLVQDIQACKKFLRDSDKVRQLSRESSTFKLSQILNSCA